MTLALSGLPQFISKYVAERKNPLERKARLAKTISFSFLEEVFFCGYLSFHLAVDCFDDGRHTIETADPDSLLYLFADAWTIFLSRKFPRKILDGTNCCFSSS